MRIQNHLYDGAIMAPSPNFTNKVIVPKYIVMHYTAAWTVKGTLERFADANSDVSAQFTIDVDGTVYQHVPCNKRAWHAGPSKFKEVTDLNSHSVGIEFVNPGFLRKIDEGTFQDAYGTRVSGESVGPMVAAPNARVGTGTFYWPAYSKDQIEAGERLVAALVSAYGILDIITHEEIDTRGWKTDPGPAFPMTRFKALLRNPSKTVVQYEVIADVLNVRSGPGTSNPVLTKLRKGAIVEAKATSAGWVQTRDGWVSADFVRLVV